MPYDDYEYEMNNKIELVGIGKACPYEKPPPYEDQS